MNIGGMQVTPPRHETAVADAGTAGHQTHSAGHVQGLQGISGFIEERLCIVRVHRHIDHSADPEARQNALFDPGIDSPAGSVVRIKLRGANFGRC